MEETLKKLHESAANPMAAGVIEVIATFRQHFGDLPASDQASIMAFISGALVLDIMAGAVYATLAKNPDQVQKVTPAEASAIVQAAQRIAIAGVDSAFRSVMQPAADRT